MLRAFRATAPVELQKREPLVARQQLVQLWQDTLQLVQGGSGPRQQAVQACDADAMTDARTPSS